MLCWASISCAFRLHFKSSTSPIGTSNTVEPVTTRLSTHHTTTKMTSRDCWGRETPTLDDGKDWIRKRLRWARLDRIDQTEVRWCWVHRLTVIPEVNQVDSQGELSFIQLRRIFISSFSNFRWSTSHLNSSQTSPSVSARSSFVRNTNYNSSTMSGQSVASSNISQAGDVRNSYRKPYLGWRSQEKLNQPRTAHERWILIFSLTFLALNNLLFFQIGIFFDVAKAIRSTTEDAAAHCNAWDSVFDQRGDVSYRALCERSDESRIAKPLGQPEYKVGGLTWITLGDL